MKKFIIEESERERILNMHKTAIQNNLVLEQVTTTPEETVKPNTQGGQKTKMSPLADDKIILGDGQELTVYPTWNQQGTEPRSTFRIVSNYGTDPSTRKQSQNFVSVSMLNNEIKGLNLTLSYDCTTQKITGTRLDTPTDPSIMKDAKYRLGTTEGRVNSQQYPSLVQTHLKHIIQKYGVSTTNGPIPQITSYYCKKA